MQEHFLPEDYLKKLKWHGEPRILGVTNASSFEENRVQYLAHSHEYLELLYVSEGHGTIYVNDDIYPVSPGSIVVYNRGSTHDEHLDSIEHYDMYAIDFTDMSYGELPEDHLVAEDIVPVLSCGQNTGKIDRIIKMMWEISKSQSLQSIGLCHKLGMAVLSYVEISLHNKKAVSNMSAVCSRVKAIINDNYQKEVTIEKLAKSVSVSPFHLSRIFKSSTGYTINEYLKRVRLGQAQSMLVYSDMSVTDIAYAVGYGSHSYFTQLFRKQFGVSPVEFKKYHLKRGTDEIQRF